MFQGNNEDILDFQILAYTNEFRENLKVPKISTFQNGIEQKAFDNFIDDCIIWHFVYSFGVSSQIRIIQLIFGLFVKLSAFTERNYPFEHYRLYNLNSVYYECLWFFLKGNYSSFIYSTNSIS